MSEKKYKHFSLDERLEMQKMLEDGISFEKIAQRINKTISTIYREKSRGLVNGKYDAITSHNNYTKSLKQKGQTSIINESIAIYISKCILDDGLFPKQIIKKMKMEKIENAPSSPNTIYKAIDEGRIPNVNRSSLRKTNTHVFSNTLICLPRNIVEECNIKNGDMVEFIVDDNQLTLIIRLNEH